MTLPVLASMAATLPPPTVPMVSCHSSRSLATGASSLPSTPGTLSGSVVNGIVTLACGATNFGSLPTGHLDTAFATPAPAGVYFVRVRAVNAFGSSAPTNEVQLVVP